MNVISELRVNTASFKLLSFIVPLVSVGWVEFNILRGSIFSPALIVLVKYNTLVPVPEAYENNLVVPSRLVRTFRTGVLLMLTGSEKTAPTVIVEDVLYELSML